MPVAGMNVMTRKAVSASHRAGAAGALPSAARGGSQIRYQGISHARLAISASVAQPARESQSVRRCSSTTTVTSDRHVGPTPAAAGAAADPERSPTTFGMLNAVSSVL